MNRDSINGRPDPELGGLLRRTVDVPTGGPGFRQRLQARLVQADSEHGGPMSRRRPGRAGRPWQFAFGAAAAAAVVALLFTLTGVPGVQHSSPQPASAAERLVANIDAGLARVQTLQGVFVLDDLLSQNPLSTNPQLERAAFAATAAGDRYFDIRYRCSRTAAVHAWRKQVKALGPDWRSAGTGGQAMSASDVANTETTLLQLRSITPRTIWACDGTSPELPQKVKHEYVDALTGKTLGWSYHDYEGYGLFAEEQGDSAAQVWSLATQLQIELDQHNPDITVADARYQGRAVQKVTIRNAAGTAVYVAYIDARYGVTLALQRVSRATPDQPLTPFHVEDLKVNQTIPASRFTISPDYRLDPVSPPQVAKHNVAKRLYIEDFGGRLYPADALGRLASSATLVPSWIPAGYRLAAVFGAPGQELALQYRQGLLQLSVGSFGLDYLNHHPAALARGDWPALPSDQVVELKHGSLAGWPAAVSFGSALGAAALSGATFSVRGDLTPHELLRVAESLRPATGTYPAAAEHSALAAAVLAAGIAIAGGVVALWLLRLRRKGREGPAIRGVGWLSPIGAAVVVLGASLDWHATLGYGHNGAFAMTGWQEPLALVTVGLALAAAAVAACLPLAGRRLPLGPRLVAVALACLAIAAAIVGVFYLPVQARFVIQGAPQLGDVWDKYFVSPASPSAGAGLYVSILGCLVVLIGVLAIKRHPEHRQTAGS